MDRRLFFRLVAGVAALPIVARLPLPLRRPLERAGAWAEVFIKDGQITAITIMSPGYNSAPFVVITPPNDPAHGPESDG
jgi:hypothetical protein